MANQQILEETNFLIRYDPKKALLLACDTSLYNLGDFLSHLMPDRSENLITFASRTLSKAERNYLQTKKEALATGCPVKKFHQCLFVRHFLLYTDHKPLLGLLSELKVIPIMAVACIKR